MMKKRLKALMALPENQVCSDCPEKKPTWASLIVPPPDAPPGTEKIGAFCCLECSGSHRRLGVHISFVRSVNLDSWKEFEVRAMECGGNAKVNAIFEANLNRAKPTNLSDGPTRERYIRDKYERRKFYNPSAYSMAGNSGGGGGGGGTPGAPASAGAAMARPGAPSDIARQRVASRQARMKTSHSQMEAPPPTTTKPKVAQAPASAPVVMDLLDFSAAPEPAPPSAPVHDPFAAPPPAAPAPVPVAPAPVQTATPTIQPPKQAQQQQQQKQAGNEFLTPAPAQQQSKSNNDIMALFNTPSTSSNPTSGFGRHSGMMMNNNMGMMGGMTPHQQGMMGGLMNQGNQQQLMQGGMMNQGNPQMNAGQMNPQMMAMMNGNNIQQQQQMMRMMMMQQQQQMKPQMQQHSLQQMNMGNMQQNLSNGFPQMNQSNAGNMMNAYGSNNNNMHSMTQGMQQMSFGGPSNGQAQEGDDGGFGAPMGGNAPQSSDPFSSLGGMNAFR
eukprot:scaffold3373_cov137-Cylindrotheca_fusiformis.AAC.20